MNEWISVNDKLPELNQRVLVYAVGKIDGFIGEHVIEICKRFVMHFLPSSPGHEVWSSPYQYFHTDYEITHWMPLPEMPKEDNDNADLDKVITGLEHCRKYGTLGGNDCFGHYMWTDERDITRLEEHHHDCPYGKCKTGCVVTLVEDAVALLKKHNRPDCEHAEHDEAGCLRYSGCSQDDEPIDACKNCDRYTGNIVREW